MEKDNYNKKVKLLFLDDNESIHTTFKILLRNEGDFGKYDVVYESCPFKALSDLKKNHYDMLICDYEMPVITGYEVLSYINNMEGVPLPTVAFSSKKQFNDYMSSFENVVTSFDKDFFSLVHFLDSYFTEKKLRGFLHEGL